MKNREYQIIFFLFTFAALLFGMYSLEVKAQRPLSQLPKPTRALVYLPQPLTLPQISLSILGAQTIDPKDIVASVNKERETRNIQPLRMHPLLMKAAKMRADVMLKHQNFSHLDPYEHIELASVLPNVGYNFAYASENIGMGGVSGPDFVNGFMHSTAHRENLLSPSLSDTGTAVVTGQYKQYYVNIAVQLFAVPGGKDETLGYTAKDVETYKTQLEQLNAKLSIPVRILAMIKREYSEENNKKLERQHTIVNTVYKRMQKQEPLNNDDVALILEYNNNFN